MPTENRSSNTEQMVSARVCAYTPGQSKVELQLIPPSALPSWLELGQQVIARPAAQHQAEGYSAGDMADQGAKVLMDGQRAMVLPDRELYTKYLPGAIPKNAAELNSYKDGWNACLEEVSRLNAAAIAPE